MHWWLKEECRCNLQGSLDAMIQDTENSQQIVGVNQRLMKMSMTMTIVMSVFLLLVFYVLLFVKLDLARTRGSAVEK